MVDVLVIGAGPTGLMMAAEALRYGMTCRIIDRASKPSDKSRALAIQPRTLEIFDHLGIVHSFLKEGLQIKSGHPYSCGKQLAHFSFEDLDSPYPFILSLEQSRTEEILTEYLSFLGAKIERGVELIDVIQKGTHVLAICQDLQSGKKIEIEAKWVVGCDGAHSVVRKKLGFAFIGKAFPTLFSLADVKIEWKYPHDELVAFLNPEGIMAAIPMPGEKRYRVVFELDRCPEETLDPTLKEVEAIVKKYGDEQAVVSDPLWFANFQINSRLVESYQKGRIFLAGDAAHIHSPAGGQGMNSGIQDAYNLAWKLASGNRELIHTYTRERRSWGKSLLKNTRRFTQVARWKNPFGVSFRNLVIRIVFPWIQRKIKETISQISIQYPKSSIVKEVGSFQGGPKAGMRAPNVPIGKSDLYTKLRKSTKHHLLIFEEDIEKLQEFDLRNMSVFKMDQGHLKYGIRKSGAYIIRPDQVVGLRSSPIDWEAIRTYIQKTH